MATILSPFCNDDCEGERGERGKRGKRGKRGHRGHDGHDGHDGRDGRDGDTGPTGPTGPTGSTGATGATGPAGSSDFNRQIFTASGIYVPSPGTSRVNVKMCGGGGAGAGSQDTAGTSVGGGGAAGAALDFVVDGPITGGPVVIGTGGIGVIGGGGGDGVLSSVTINATVFTAAPGSGGNLGNSAGPTTPAFGGGGVTQAGSSAVDIVSGDNGMHGAGDNTNVIAGHGGSGEFGIGGEGSTGGGPGLPGSGRGAGGGGAASFPASGAFAGGDGAPGVVIIDEFIG